MIGAGFEDPVSGAQATFRAVLAATARPGTIVPVRTLLAAPEPLSAATAAVALTLCDQDTAVWLDAALRTAAIIDWLRFHTGARVVDDPFRAAFAFAGAANDMLPFSALNPGLPEYPDRSTTLVLQVSSFREGPHHVLTGPGIRDRQGMQATPLPSDFAERLAANRRLFPCGIDLLLCTPTEILALPRSVRLAPDNAILISDHTSPKRDERQDFSTRSPHALDI
jgi:alpha-D-ribose 1-methylphosphonate 5-triphosphate synthase subunit PhnH